MLVRVRAAGVVALAGLASGCLVGQRPVVEPTGSEAAALVGSAALGGPLVGIARHPWISLRERNGVEWERWEVMCCPDGGRYGTVRRTHIDPLSDHGGGGGDVRLHGVWRGTEAERIIACVREEAPRYPYRDEYLVWPGPNSNTFVDFMIRACDLHVELPATAIGKGYRGPALGASVTPGGTGLQVETALVGAQIGITEGVELHLLGMAWGIDLFPPAIIVPVNPGRIGFDDR
jgi:hypothetical protein